MCASTVLSKVHVLLTHYLDYVTKYPLQWRPVKCCAIIVILDTAIYWTYERAKHTLLISIAFLDMSLKINIVTIGIFVYISIYVHAIDIFDISFNCILAIIRYSFTWNTYTFVNTLHHYTIQFLQLSFKHLLFCIFKRTFL